MWAAAMALFGDLVATMAGKELPGCHHGQCPPRAFALAEPGAADTRGCPSMRGTPLGSRCGQSCDGFSAHGLPAPPHVHAHTQINNPRLKGTPRVCCLCSLACGGGSSCALNLLKYGLSPTLCLPVACVKASKTQLGLPGAASSEMNITALSSAWAGTAADGPPEAALRSRAGGRRVASGKGMGTPRAPQAPSDPTWSL